MARPLAEFAPRARMLAEKLIEPLRETAKALGYALTVHGSLSHDIDLVAVPWIEGAASPRVLADAIQTRAQELNHGIAIYGPGEDTEYFKAGCPGGKPNGRFAWTFHLGGGPYIDLSVIAPHPDQQDIDLGEFMLRQEKEF